MDQETIKKIKFSRLKPEEKFLVDILDGCVKKDLNTYPESIFYEYDNVLIFEYNSRNKQLYVNLSNKIFKKINNKLSAEYLIQMQKYVELYYNIKILFISFAKSKKHKIYNLFLTTKSLK